MVDQRTKHLRRLSRLRRSSRRWSVLAGSLTGVAAILAPYHGLGWPDAIWAGLAGGSAALSWWRWSDLRALRALPVPDAPPAQSPPRDRWLAVAAKLPVGREAVAHMQRYQAKVRIHGSAVAPLWKRLDRASAVLTELTPRITGHQQASQMLAEATHAEHALRELGERTVSVARAMGLTGAGEQLTRAHAQLLAHFTEGVEAYERLVGAAAELVALDGQQTNDPGPIGRLREAADLLGGIAAGLAELRTNG